MHDNNDLETSIVGSISWALYLSYFTYGTGIFGIIFAIFVEIIATGSVKFSDWYLTYWLVDLHDIFIITNYSQFIIIK